MRLLRRNAGVRQRGDRCADGDVSTLKPRSCGTTAPPRSRSRLRGIPYVVRRVDLSLRPLQRKRNKARLITGLNLDEDIDLFFVCGVFRSFFYPVGDIGRLGNGLAGDLKNDVAGLEAFVSGIAPRIDFGDRDPLVARARQLHRWS